VVITPTQPGASETIPVGEDNDVVISVPSEQGGSSGSSGVGVREVRLVFENVTSGGSVSVVTETLGEISHLFDSTVGFHATVELDGANYTTVGGVYDIESTSQLAFEGVVDVTIPYDQNLVESAGGKVNETDVRFLHNNGSAWEDVTVGLNTTSNTVTGRLTGLSPVVAALIDDGTFGPAYFELYPLAKVSIDEPVITDGIIATSLQNITRGQEIMISSALKNAQRTSQPYVYIVEILSPRGYVENILQESGQLERGETVKVTVSWVTKERQAIGDYEIRIIVLSDLQAPHVLADMVTANVHLVREQT
jgi:hypothetical protein